MGALIERGWWRRNLVPLIAVAVTAAATVVVGVIVPLRGDAPDAPRRVASDRTVTLDHATFRLTRSGVFHPDGKPGVDVPKGSMVLAVLIRVTTAAELERYCSVTLVRDGTDKISWRTLDLPSEYGYGLSDSTVHSCSLDDTRGARTLEQTFLVPDDVYRHVTVRIQLTPKTAGHGDVETAALELPATPYSDRSAG